jgi:release factor glutamine methyltransferase
MKVTSNKAIDVYKYYRDLLVDLYGPEEASSLIAILFEHYVSLKRYEILSGAARRISESELLKIHFACKELLKQRPIQYIIGTAWFYENPFLVSEGVLIPRPETEELCYWIIKDSLITFKDSSNIRILDIGTGSGCIAITLKKNIDRSIVTALDVSPEALKVAATNAKTLCTEIDFLQADILRMESLPANSLDIIVSNPPYVCESEKEWMKPNVLEHEPHLALFVPDQDPLVFYEAIAKLALHALTPDGKLYFEINENLHDALVILMKNLGFSQLAFRSDMNGKTRMLLCTR